MRTLIGSLVLIVGLIGLGGWAYVDHAQSIEDRIDADVQAIVGLQDYGLAATVSGRDVHVTGRVGDALDLSALTASLRDTHGLRRLDLHGVDVLPLADPFALSIVKMGQVWTAQGVVPSNRVRSLFEGATRADFAALTLAAGAPAGWEDMGERALTELAQLDEGAVDLTGSTVTFTATVDTPTHKGRIIDALAGVDGFTVVDDITARDDGTPMRIRLVRDDGTIRGAAKLPQGMDSQVIEDRFGDLSGLELTQSVLAAPVPDWPGAAELSMDALALLISGSLAIVDENVTLTGEGTPDGIAAAEQRLAGLSAAYDVRTELSVYGADRPLILSMDWDGTQGRATGTFPADFAPRGPQGTRVINEGEVMFLPDPDGAFSANADAGVAALGFLQTGILTVTADEIALAGTAVSPQVNASIDAVLANVAPDTGITRTLTYLDDGSPAAWQVTYDAARGAQVDGRLPLGLDAAGIGAAFGIEVSDINTTTALQDDSTGRFGEVVEVLATYLPEIETLTFRQGSDGVSFDLVASPGVEIDLIALDLVARLPSDVAFSISPLEPLPATGTLRVNAATGLTEIFLDGFWIPDLNFPTTLDGCAAEASRLLASGGITFLSSSARLDATSIRAINTLAAIAVPCVEADLELEVAGHTDASGDATQNQILSQDRAEAVRAALTARGVPARAITAIGLGDSQPVADNDTPEGRAQNRRTDILWFERGALRDP